MIKSNGGANCMPDLLVEGIRPSVENLVGAFGGGEIMTTTQSLEITTSPNVDAAYTAELTELTENVTPDQEKEWKEVRMSKRSGGGDCCLGDDYVGK